MGELAEQQIRNNADSRGLWDVFRPHREKVTRLLLAPAARGPSRLCVLGAGNCNDLDLAALVAAYREVHLVDLDADALADGVRRQGLSGSFALRQHAGVDVTGALDVLAGWSPKAAIVDEAIAACVENPLRRVLPSLPGPFDVAASTCLLSQLIGCVVRTVGEAHPRFVAALQAIRAGHLRLLADLTAPGGVAVLITDVLSSDTYPSLAGVGESQLPTLLPELARRRNLFHGVNPAVIASFLQADPVVAPQVAALERAGPWLWDFGPRVYLVVAWIVHKRSAPVSHGFAVQESPEGQLPAGRPDEKRKGVGVPDQ